MRETLDPLPLGSAPAGDDIGGVTTAGGVIPVARLGCRILGNDRPGPISMKLKEAYRARHEEGRHRTPVRPLDEEAA